MSIEGGKFTCTVHNFETEDVKAWDDHCFEDPEHTLKVIKQCPNCLEETGEKFEFRELAYPYPKKFVEKAHKKQATGILLKCPQCGEMV